MRIKCFLFVSRGIRVKKKKIKLADDAAISVVVVER